MYMSKIHTNIISMGIVTLPFINSVKIGGTSDVSISGYIIYCGVIAWILQILIQRKAVLVPNDKSFKSICVFIVGIFFSGIININEITYLHNSFQKFFFGWIHIIFSMMSAIYLYNFMILYNGNVLHFIINRFIISFILAGTYSLLELECIFNGSTDFILKSIDNIFRGDAEAEVFHSILHVRSLTYESSLLGNYIAVVFPFLFYIAIKKKKYYWILPFYALIMVIFSLSRTSYILAFIELIFLAFIYRTSIFRKKNLFVILSVVMLSSYLCFEFGVDFDKYDPIELISSIFTLDDQIRGNSNMMRYGSQLAALNIFIDYPLLGVGWNQQAFYLLDYYPDFIWHTHDIKFFQYSPTIFGLYPSLLAQCGVIGLLSWILIWFFALQNLYYAYKSTNNNDHEILLLFVVAIIGMLIAAWNWGIIHWSSYWILLAISWYSYNTVSMKNNGGYYK